MTDTVLVINGVADTVYRGKTKAEVEDRVRASVYLPSTAQFVETDAEVFGGMVYSDGVFEPSEGG